MPPVWRPRSRSGWQDQGARQARYQKAGGEEGVRKTPYCNVSKEIGYKSSSPEDNFEACRGQEGFLTQLPKLENAGLLSSHARK